MNLHVTIRKSLPTLKLAFAAGILLNLLAAGISAQSLRICTYNVLDKPTTSDQNAELQVILQAIGQLEILGRVAPLDLLAFQEGPQSASVYDEFEASFESVFGGNYESTISTADFFGCRTGFIYNADRLILLNSTTLGGNLTHNTRRCRFRPVDGDSSDEFYIYSLHLKAGQDDAAIRAGEAAIIRNNAETLPSSANIFYVGDFNIRGSSEPAFQHFLEAGDNATAINTWNVPFGFRSNVLWNDNLAFQPFHTQDPTGNLDDRFDAILVNARLADGTGLDYRPGSLSVLGNNGTHNLGQSVNTGNGGAGFAGELVAFSDHLPVVCELKYGQLATPFNVAMQAPAVVSRTVRPTGPVVGNAGDVFFNIEGSANGSFASFGVVDFDLSSQIAATDAASVAGNLVLELSQSNAGFSQNGPVSIYLATDAAAKVAINGTIQYQSGQNRLNCVPAVLADGAVRVATYAAVHRTGNGGGANLPNGTLDPMRLFGEQIETAVVSAINGNGILRLLITPDQAATAATYAGFASTLGGPQLVGDLEVNDNVIDILVDSFSLANGAQGPGSVKDLNQSDDQRIRFFASQPENKSHAWIQLVLAGSLPSPELTSLSVVLESRVNTPHIELTMELFNFAAGSWESIATAESQLSDDQIEITPSGDVGSFVASDGQILARLSWRPTGPVLQFPWSCDINWFKWKVGP